MASVTYVLEPPGLPDAAFRLPAELAAKKALEAHDAKTSEKHFVHSGGGLSAGAADSSSMRGMAAPLLES